MDDLLDWLSEDSVKDALVLDEQPDPGLVRRVMERGYAPDLREDELQRLGRDPFLIAYALVEPTRRRIVTTEISSPKKRRANRKIPDVAKRFGIESCDVFPVYAGAGFQDRLAGR